MKIIDVRNVNEALPLGIEYLRTNGISEQSRNGAVLVAPEPVMTVYRNPWERVLFDPIRDANPFFHFFESLWMLAGNNDVAFPAHFAANIANFSDDGKTVAGAYGHRWREHFGYDQLAWIVDELKANPQTRRAVLTMWDASDQNGECTNDLYKATHGGKDVPCNTHAYFDTIGGKLNMTVCCRSNDMVWGAYGANAVHFSFLHEYVTRATGLRPGVYRQFSNNFHAYIERADTVKLFENGVGGATNAYSILGPYPLMDHADEFDADVASFFHLWTPNVTFGSIFRSDFFNSVAAPLSNAHHYYKHQKWEEAQRSAAMCASLDWRHAAQAWLARREFNSKKAFK